MRARLVLLALVGLARADMAEAGEAECDRILAAARATAAARSYAVSVQGGGSPLPRDHRNAAGPVRPHGLGWQPLGPDYDLRHTLMARMRVDGVGPTNCTELGPVRLRGRVMNVLQFLPPPRSGLEIRTAAIWIGEDGRVHRLVSGQSTMDFRYEGVRAPMR